MQVEIKTYTVTYRVSVYMYILYLYKHVFIYKICILRASQVTSGKEPACQCRRHKRCRFDLGLGRSLEEGMAAHSSILAWRIPWTEEPGRLPSIGWQSWT